MAAQKMSAEEGLAKMRDIVLQAWDAAEGEGQFKAKLDEVKRIALASGLAYFLDLPPHIVGIHPDNRNSIGCSGKWMQRLGGEIVDAGYSPDEAKGAVVFEDLKDHKGATFTVELQSRSPLLPKQILAEIAFVCCGGCHTYQFFNAVLQGITCSNPMLAENGYMSKEKILRKCPQMAEPLEKGLNCFVFRAKCWEEIPKLPWLVQAGANKPNGARTKPGQFQSLSAMQEDVSQTMNASMSASNPMVIDKTAVKRHAAKDSEHVEDFNGMIDWIVVYGGGRSGFYTKELCSYVAEVCADNAAVKGEVFAAIAKWNLPTDNLCPMSACALLKLAARRPLLKISPGDAKKIGALEYLPVIEGLLKDGRRICGEVHGGYKSQLRSVH